MIIVAERINSSRKSIAQAIENKDAEFLKAEALAQEKAGATYIDVNAGTFVNDEADRLKWVVEVVQEATTLPLCLDSADSEVIKKVLPLVSQTPMINSITLEPNRLENILPLAVENNTRLIALCQSSSAMPTNAEAKVDLADQLVAKASEAGLPLEDLFIDPLIFPISTDSGSALASLDAIETIMKKYPTVHTICGLTNVSFGLPNRKLINRTFLVGAIGRGLDSAILDPTDPELKSSLLTALMMAGKDNYCMGYITAFKHGELA